MAADCAEMVVRFLFGGWQPEPTLRELLTLLMVFAVLKFTVALLILKWMPLRLR